MSQATTDLTHAFFIMLVGLDRAGVTACARAIDPIKTVEIATCGEACVRLPQTRPLVVVVGANAAESDRATLSEIAFACGAEIVVPTQFGDSRALGDELLAAIRRAERRRST